MKILDFEREKAVSAEKIINKELEITNINNLRNIL